MEIKNIYGDVIYSDESRTIKETVENAVKKCANLNGANLRDAYLRGTYLDGAVKVPFLCKWSHGITDGLIHIGCEKRTPKEWEDFLNSNNEIETERGTQEFKQIEAVIRAYIEYLKVING